MTGRIVSHYLHLISSQSEQDTWCSLSLVSVLSFYTLSGLYIDYARHFALNSEIMNFAFGKLHANTIRNLSK